MRDELESRGLNRREFLRRAAVTGATVAWVTPMVQTIGMGRAAAQSTTPCDPKISFVAMNVVCSNGTEECHYLKYDEPQGGWVCDTGIGQVPSQCPDFVPCDNRESGNCDLVDIEGDEFQATLTVTRAGCVIRDIAVKGGQICNVQNGVNVTQITVRCPS